MGRNKHVVPRPSGWAVRNEGSNRDLSHHRTQKAAIDTARKQAKNVRADVVIHGRDGKTVHRSRCAGKFVQRSSYRGGKPGTTSTGPKKFNKK